MLFRSPESKFDLIIANEIIEHFHEPDIVLNKFYNWLKPGGLIFIETPNLRSWDKNSLWRNRIGGMFYGTDHRIIYTPRSITELLKRNYFVIKNIETRTISPTIFKELVMSIIIRKKQKIKKQIHSNSNQKKNHTQIKYNYYYENILNSFLVDLILSIPNKISQINQKGNFIYVLAQKKLRFKLDS